MLTGVADRPVTMDALYSMLRDVAQRGMRSHDHEHVGKPAARTPRESRPVLPFSFRLPVHPTDVDTIETAGDSVEAGRIDDHIEGMFGVGLS